MFTHETFPRLAAAPVPPASSTRMPLQDGEVRHDGEPIALVLADTLEAAEHAASLVGCETEPAPFTPHPGGERDGAVRPRESNYLFVGYIDADHGDVDAGLAGAEVRHEADIPSAIDVGFIDEVDEHASPIGGKGIGELGATGVDAAVAEPVVQATGRRIRELPITPDKLVA